MEKTTTIEVKESIRERLKSIRITPNETYSNVIARMFLMLDDAGKKLGYIKNKDEKNAKE